MYQHIKEMDENTAIENLVEEVTMGRGIIHLMDQELKDLLDIEGPYLQTQVFNTREASLENVRKLWTKTGSGSNLQSKSVEHEVIVGVHGADDVAEDWSKKWDQKVIWSSQGSKGSAILLNGNHRLQLIKTFALEKGLEELAIHQKAANGIQAQKIKDELELKIEWVARLINMGKS